MVDLAVTAGLGLDGLRLEVAWWYSNASAPIQLRIFCLEDRRGWHGADVVHVEWH